MFQVYPAYVGATHTVQHGLSLIERRYVYQHLVTPIPYLVTMYILDLSSVGYSLPSLFRGYAHYSISPAYTRGYVY